jgi:ubiquinol-cytochrome c reductase cytochrome c1 subunit
MRKPVALLAGLAGLVLAAGAMAQEEERPPLLNPPSGWSFSGVFGTFDRASLQRGYQIYSEVCSNCHSMNLLYYRNLAALGYNEDQIKAFAAQKEVTDGPNDQGEMFKRPARPYDHFVAPFANEKAARAANNGALPPDLSLVIKAREGGADYVYSLLQGYKPPPSDFKLAEGMQYNLYFPGHQIAMPPPLADNAVTFADGTPATLQQEAHDVAAFLTWASEPTMEDRKRTGAKVILFLLVMAGLLYGTKRKIWADLH